MKIHVLLQHIALDEPKLIRIKIFLSKYWHFLLLICLGLACFVYYIVKNARPPLLPPKFYLNSLEDCLTSGGVDSKNIIWRDNGTKYTEINWQWNTVNGYLQPMVYLIANNVMDVQNAVICCQIFKVRLVARSGGHSLVKYGFGDSNTLVIDLKRLNQITIDPIQMNCVIGAGARTGLITYTLWRAGGFMIPVSLCPTVGISGLALGGGYGYYTRLFGLVSDNLLELEMVDATGKVLLINNSTNEDLFWALRGGGGGSFGIVTKLKFKMHSAPKNVVYGMYEYSIDDFPQYYEAWQTFITSDQPHNIGTLTRMHSNKIEMEIFKFYLQDKEKVNMVEFDNIFNSSTFPTDNVRSIKQMSYREFILVTAQHYSKTPLNHPSDIANIKKHNIVGMTKVKSMYVDTILHKDKISELHDVFKEYLKFASLQIECNMGAINNFSCEETAFIHRGMNLYHIELEFVNDENAEINLEALASMNTFYEDSKAVLNHRESYQNYADQDVPDYLERYYGANLDKLIQVKRRVDPGNVFNHPQSIPTSFV